jgi:hypothetical protein
MMRAAPVMAIVLGISAAVPAHAGSGNTKPDGSVFIAGQFVDTFGHRSSNILIVPRDGRRLDPFAFRHDSFRAKRDSFFFDDRFRTNRTIFRKERERLFADDAFRRNRDFFRSNTDFFRKERERLFLNDTFRRNRDHFRSDADFFRADRKFFRPGHGTVQRLPSQPRFTTGTMSFTTGRLPPSTTQRQGSHRR